MSKLQPLVFSISLVLVGAGLVVSAPARAQEGFYGLSLRDGGVQSTGLSNGGGVRGLSIGKLPLNWNRFGSSASDDVTAQRSLVFGGFRWKNDIAVEAAVNGRDAYAFGPASLAPTSSGSPLGDVSARSWNADLFTSWEFVRSFSVYGRLGYSQTEVRPLFAGASVIPGDPRRRDGVNYGLGLRYDVTRSLGMRVEYARFGRFTGDVAGNGLPDSDQVSIGLQFRF